MSKPLLFIFFCVYFFLIDCFVFEQDSNMRTAQREGERGSRVSWREIYKFIYI